MDVVLFSFEKVEPVCEFMNECVRLNQRLLHNRLHVISFFQIIDRFSLAHANFYKDCLWLHCELVVSPGIYHKGFYQ